MTIPYDIGTLATGQPDPRVRWPIALAVTKAINAAVRREIVGTVRSETDSVVADVLQIAAPAIQITFFTTLNAAAVAAAAREQGLTLAFSQDALARGDTALVGRSYDLLRQRFRTIMSGGMTGTARALARSLSKMAPGQLLGAPILAINPNTLLDRAVPDADGRVMFFSDPSGALAVEAAIPSALEERLTGLADHLAASTCRSLPAIGGWTCPPELAAELAAATGGWLRTVAGHRASIETAWRRPPRRLWTGTGGNYASRQLRAAVRRSGGHVTGFEHGGGGHIHADLGSEVVNEFWLCDRFVADTGPKAEVYAEGLRQTDSLATTPPEVAGARSGRATMAWGPGSRPRGEIQRVVYATTAFVGETCYPIQPLMPDVVHADWQGRLAGSLAALGYEVLVKQHPQGLAGGRPLVMTDKARYIGGSFADAMEAADAFVFDYPATTSLWEAMLTAKPVVFVDLGLADWNPTVRRLFERRCTVVRGRFDDGNRPVVNAEELSAALQAPPGDDAFAVAYLTGTARP